MVRFLSTPRLRSAALPFAANGVLYGTWAARIPEVQARCGLTEGQLGVALLGAAAGLVVAASLAGRLVARRGALSVARAGLAAFAVAVVGPGLAVGLGSLAAVLVGVGLASGVLDVAMNAWATDVEAETGRPIPGRVPRHVQPGRDGRGGARRAGGRGVRPARSPLRYQRARLCRRSLAPEPRRRRTRCAGRLRQPRDRSRSWHCPWARSPGWPRSPSAD